MRPLATGRAIVLGLWLLAVLPATVVSATLWSLTASPSSLTRNVEATVRWELAVHDVTSLGQDRVGCLVLRLPSQLQAHDATIVGTNAGSSWSAGVKNGGATVEIRADKQSGRLSSGDFVRFTVATTGTPAGGPYVVRGDAYGDRNCDSKSRLVLLGTIERSFTVSRPDPVTPSPSPPPTKPPATAKPDPSASPTPRVRRSPTAAPETSQPSAAPTAPSPTPTTPSPSPTPRVQSPLPSATASPSLAPAAASPSPSPSPPAAGSWYRLPPADRGGVEQPPAGFDSTVRSLAALSSSQVWFVPALVTGVPGLLILLLVLANTLLGMSWIPGIGRLLGPEPSPPHEDQQLWWAGGRPTLD